MTKNIRETGKHTGLRVFGACKLVIGKTILVIGSRLPTRELWPVSVAQFVVGTQMSAKKALNQVHFANVVVNRSS